MDYGSKWNQLRKAFLENRSARIDGVGKDGISCTSARAVHPGELEQFNRVTTDMLDSLEGSAHFVVSRSLSDMLWEKRQTFISSLIAMAEAGLLRLPFPRMLIEMDDPDVDNSTTFVALNEKEGQPGCFEMMKLSYAKALDGGEAAVLWPILIEFSMRRNPNGTDWRDSLILDIALAPMTPQDEKLSTSYTTVETLRSTVAASVVFGCMLWRTKGLAKEVVRAPPKLNAARIKAGKKPLRDYTLLKVGQVYDRQGVAHDVSRGRSGWTMPVHWRCGHWRNQAHGQGWKERRRIWIDPILCNYEGDAPAPKPKFLATT